MLKKNLYALIVLLFLINALALAPPMPVSALASFADIPEEPRNIYVGDVIALEITAKDVSLQDLKAKFSDFEIVELREGSDGYLISLRTFTPGEYTVILGNQEIVIHVRSTLDDIDREDIFEGDARVAESASPSPWLMLFYVAAGIFALSGGFVLLRIVRKKKDKALTPHQLFLRRSGALAAKDENFLVDLTRYFKEYLEKFYQYRIIGKTSTEIIAELRGLPALEPLLSDIGAWLTECDRLKFTGVGVSIEEKQEQYQKLVNLVAIIDETKEGVA